METLDIIYCILLGLLVIFCAWFAIGISKTNKLDSSPLAGIIQYGESKDGEKWVGIKFSEDIEKILEENDAIKLTVQKNKGV